MADLTSLPLELNNKTSTCRAIIETPKGCRNKFDYDPETGLFMLGGLLPEGMMFPFDFGFLPSTLGEDGDPLDIMVLMDAPAHIGCLIEVRIIGIIDAEQTQDGKTEKNSRILGAAVHSYEHENLVNMADVSKTLVPDGRVLRLLQQAAREEIQDHRHGGPKKALRYLNSGIQAHQKDVKK